MAAPRSPTPKQGRTPPAPPDAAEIARIRIIYCFVHGISVAVAARTVGLSAKTVRSHYLALRKRLLEPAFNRWHGTNRMLVNVPGPEHEVMIRAGFFDAMARCALNEHCARNWRLGNRKRRQCRKCPLAYAFTTDERRAEAYAVIDAVHAFYEHLGIRGEKEIPPVLLFEERLVHTTAVASFKTSNQKRFDQSSISENMLLTILF